ncbi:MAG TPA: nucleotidyltransferase family protein [Herbaspirillum sp.]|jgi:molybdenum cofactor cytidylyltransferase
MSEFSTPAQAGIVGLLLAAGKGSRFDASGRESKLLAALPDGTPVALASARRLLQCCARVLAVLPQHAAPPRDQHVLQLVGLLAEAGCEIVFCADSDAGLGHSLAAGVRAAPHAAGWLVALADMPAIEVSTLRAVAAACTQPRHIAAPIYRARRGHPVVFGSAYYAGLAALQGDQGARGVLLDHASAVTEVPCDDAGVLRDIDTPADLENLPHRDRA